MEIFYGRYLSCLLCSLGPGTLANGLCTGGAGAVHHTEHDPVFSPRRARATLRAAGALKGGLQVCVLLHSEPFQFFPLHCFGPPPPLFADSAALSLSPQITVFIYEGGKNQYNTKQWLIGLRVRCAERSLLYIMYGGQLMVSVLADKWTVSISPV